MTRVHEAVGRCTRLSWPAVLLGVAAGLLPREINGAPETFNTALPVAKGEFVFREQFLYKKASGDPSPADRDLEVLGGISVLGYGATSGLAVFGAVPVLDKTLELTAAEGRRVERGRSGPAPGTPVVIPAGMQGDRAFIVFASPEDAGTVLRTTC